VDRLPNIFICVHETALYKTVTSVREGEGKLITRPLKRRLMHTKMIKVTSE